MSNISRHITLRAIGQVSTILFTLLATSTVTPRLVAAQGSLAGQITDAVTGETLIGVNVIVVGTNHGAATDLDGNYNVPGISAGAYSVNVSYIGFQTKLFTGIVIADGEVTRLDVELEEAVLSTEGEVVVIGERPLMDVEQASSAFAISREQLDAAPLQDVQDAVATQVGVVRDPTGLYIRGGRAEETGFIVDGVSAKDPLAGTGFGLDIGSNAFQEVEVTTGGVSADVGDVTSGVVSVEIQEGTDQFHGYVSHQRDNFGFNESSAASFNEEVYEINLSGPILPGRLRFFTSGQVQLSDGFTRNTSLPDQLRSSLIDGTFLMPRAANRWSGLLKLSWAVAPGKKFQGSLQRSVSVNQNTRSLQVTGNESVISPGFQYAFVLQPDNANTFAHDNIVSYVKWSHVLSERSFYDIQVSRLFTRLRADANGRDWRPDNVDTELDPESIVPYPATPFVDENGDPFNPNALFVLPGPGFYNNGGVATRFHDHFAEEYTVHASYTLFSRSQSNRTTIGLESKFNDYQWIDVIRPWVGAPIGTEDGTSTGRLGESSDIWRVKPRRGALYAMHQIRYRGLIANAGLRFEYWAPGKYVDDLVADELAPVLPAIRESYWNSTVKLFGLRTKFRLLPKLRVSFPIQDNRVMYFNYGHSTRVPHPTFVYTGLDPFYQDRSFFADLGNPDLNPEVDISYEIGLRNQFSSNDVLNVVAFWRDKFDFITVESVLIRDQTGRETTRAFRVNGDFARVRGVEVSYLKRIGSWFEGQVSGSFSRATGLSSTNNDALAQFLVSGDIDNTFETPLAWDRPLDLKSSVTLSWDKDNPMFGVPGLNRLRLYVSGNYRSGQRYTPVEFVGLEQNPITGVRDWRPIYETVQDPSKRFSEIGDAWLWFDLRLQRSIGIAGSDVNVSLEVTNLLNRRNAVIINPVTGGAYPVIDEDTDFVALRGNSDYDVTSNTRDPRFEDPSSGGLPPLNPARYLPQRHITLGLSFRF